MILKILSHSDGILWQNEPNAKKIYPPLFFGKEKKTELLLNYWEVQFYLFYRKSKKKTSFSKLGGTLGVGVVPPPQTPRLKSLRGAFALFHNRPKSARMEYESPSLCSCRVWIVSYNNRERPAALVSEFKFQHRGAHIWRKAPGAILALREHSVNQSVNQSIN